MTVESMQLLDEIHYHFRRHSKLGEVKSKRAAEGIIFSLQDAGIIKHEAVDHFQAVKTDGELPSLPAFTMIVAKGIERAERDKYFPTHMTVTGLLDAAIEIYELVDSRLSGKQHDSRKPQGN